MLTPVPFFNSLLFAAYWHKLLDSKLITVGELLLNIQSVPLSEFTPGIWPHNPADDQSSYARISGNVNNISKETQQMMEEMLSKASYMKWWNATK